MSPVGPYPNMEACIVDNQDKDDPGAFCAFLEKETESTLDTKMGQLAIDKGFVRKNGRWIRMTKNQAMTTKTLAGVEIFAVGEHNGEIYLEADLDEMVRAFKALKGRVDPPVKVGHTSDDFNRQLARKLGVEEDILQGDAGNGAMALGWVSRLYREDKILKGDFSDVPEPLADLIKSRAYNQVSAEVLFDFEDEGVLYPKVLTAVALLGAELPAVRETAGLEEVAVFTYTLKPTKTVLFDLQDAAKNVTYEEIVPTIDAVEAALESAIKGKVGAPLLRAFMKDIKAKVRNMLSRKHEAGQKTDKEEYVMKALLALLGLKEEATEEEAVTALKALQLQADTKVELKEMAEALGLEGEVDKDGIIEALKSLKAEPNKNTGETQDFADLKTKVMTLQTDLAGEKRKGRVAHFIEMAKGWPTISGKPEEIGEKLTKLEEANKGAAEDMVKAYSDTNDQLVAAGITRAIGTPEEGNAEGDSEFEKEVKKYQDDKHVDHDTAFAELRKDRPELFHDFMKNRTRVYTKSPANREE